MSKRFDCEDEPNEFMEMPCQCDCGKWFDLTDGYRSGKTTVCRECHEWDLLEESTEEESSELDILEEDEDWDDEDGIEIDDELLNDFVDLVTGNRSVLDMGLPNRFISPPSIKVKE